MGCDAGTGAAGVIGAPGQQHAGPEQDEGQSRVCVLHRASSNGGKCHGRGSVAAPLDKRLREENLKKNILGRAIAAVQFDGRTRDWNRL
jgi:hypothetical protein